jgi:predicted MPP superfamily phosphohydrolase
VKLAWATDIHLTFLSRDQVVTWCRETLAAGDPDAILLSGDLAEAHDLEDWLLLLAELLRRPIYFVLGNHDFYRGSIETVRARMARLTESSRHLFWLGATDVVPLTDRTALVGHDGWGDARFGDHARSTLRMNDFRLIEELAGLTHAELGEKLRALGDEAADHLQRVLPSALEHHRDVLCLTHVPPVREAAVWRGRIANDEWAPYFTCKALGDVLLDVMTEHPEHHLTALCGHTHSAIDVEPLPNFRVQVGGAEYRAPEVQQPLIVVE